MIELAVGWYLYSSEAPLALKFIYWFMLTGLIIGKLTYSYRQADK